MQKNGLNSTKDSPPLTLDLFSGITRRLAALWPKHATRVVLAVVAAGLFAASAAHAAPTSTLYITDESLTPVSYNEFSNTLITIQGGTGAMSLTPMQGRDAAIAVTTTIKTLVINTFVTPAVVGPGYQYTLNGTFTGTTYPVPSAVANAAFWDGTSDGTNNYAVDDSQTGNVWKFDGNWANPTLLFNSFGSATGIAYDAVNNSLWISTWQTGVMYDYSMTGTLLSQFAPIHANDTNDGWYYTPIAFDPADGTLWAFNGNNLEQYSTTGNLLSTFDLGACDGDNIYGMDFAQTAPVPIPSALLLLGPGLAGLAFLKRRVFGI
jgi:hypothetical protein